MKIVFSFLFSNAILFNPVNIVQVPSSIDETKNILLPNPFQTRLSYIIVTL